MHTILSSATKTVRIGDDQPFAIIGERINPTGRKIFQLQLRNGVTLFGKFDGEFARNSQTYAGTGTIRYAW